MLNCAVAKRTWAQDVNDDPTVIGALKCEDKGKDKGKGRSHGEDSEVNGKPKDENFSQSTYRGKSG